MTTINECIVCGAEIKQNTSKKKMYCSPECKKVRNNRVRRDKSRVLRGVRNCKSCGKEINNVGTSRRAYCDSRCKDSFYIKNKRDKWTRIQMRYRITQEEWESLLAKQGGVCAICKKYSDLWHTDHDHNCCAGSDKRTCGKCVRGILCNKCNQALGMFDDDRERLARALEYVR